MNIDVKEMDGFAEYNNALKEVMGAAEIRQDSELYNQAMELLPLYM